MFQILNFFLNCVQIIDKLIENVLQKETGVIGERLMFIRVKDECLDATLHLLLHLGAFFHLLLKSFDPC